MMSPLRLSLVATLIAASAFAATLEEESAAFAKRFDAAQPQGEGMGIWKLDWEDHLSTALKRAKEEQRPVLFIHVTNISGPSNFGSGHC